MQNLMPVHIGTKCSAV